ncbi:MAG TPA: glycerate kinase, partial [Propionibacteriaceae bacterium]
MRVLVATDSIGSHFSARAGRLLASGWPAEDVTVLPMGEAGAGFVQAAADQLGADLEAAVRTDQLVSVATGAGVTVLSVELTSRRTAGPIDHQASSAALGQAAAQQLSAVGQMRQLVLDLTGLGAHDGGAGFLAALGATADASMTDGVGGLAELSRLDLEPARARLAGIELVGVAATEEIEQQLLGLRGITSMHTREPEVDRARLLATDAALANLAQLAAPERAGHPGAGAAGGIGFAILALGGRLTTGPRYALEAASARAAVASTDLVVT